MSLTLGLPVFAIAASVTPSATVTSFVSVRNQPGTDGVLLAALRPGNSVPLLGAVGDWYVVNWESQTGYINRDWVDVVAGDPAIKLSDAEIEAVTAIVKVIPVDSVKSYVRVREKPDFNSKMVAALYQGQALELVSETDDWFVVNLPGRQGYISRSWGKRIGSDTGLPEQLASSDNIVAEAEINAPAQDLSDLPIVESIPLADETGAVSAIPIQESQIQTSDSTPDQSLVVADPIMTISEPAIIESEPIEETSTAEDLVAANSNVVHVMPSDKVTTFVLIRAQPDTSSPILSRLPPGNSVQLISESGDWYQVVRNGQTGYISRFWAQKLGDVTDVPLQPLRAASPVDNSVSPITQSAPLIDTIESPPPATDRVSAAIAIVDDDKPEFDSSQVETLTPRSLQSVEISAAYPLQSVREPGDRAQMIAATELLENDQPRDAYMMLSGLEPAWAGHAGFDYLLGVAALSSGNASEAVFSLDRVVYSLPGFVGARLELARALYEVGDYGRARKEFQALLDAQPPAPVRDIILSYLDALKTAARLDHREIYKPLVNYAVVPGRPQ